MKEIKIDNCVRYDFCPLCESRFIYSLGHINYSSLFSSHKINLLHNPEYWKCGTCKSTFVQNIISEEVAKKLYIENDENRWVVEDFTKSKTPELIHNIVPLLVAGENILDIGCNSGEFLDLAQKNGCNTFGLEYSEIGKNESTKKGHIVFSSFSSLPENLKFEKIFAFDLVEHLYDINKFLLACSKVLRDNGQLIILTGNPGCLSAKLAKNRWWYASHPEHVIFPSKKFLSNLDLFGLKLYNFVFNSKYFERQYLFYLNFSIYKKIKNFLKQIVKMSYSGLPSVSRDHALIILYKKNEKNIE